MNLELENLFIEIENEYNIELQDYFKLSEEKKDGLTKLVLKYYLNRIKEAPFMIIIILDSINKLINISLEEEEYEKVEIMKRVFDDLNKIYQ